MPPLVVVIHKIGNHDLAARRTLARWPLDNHHAALGLKAP
jgi:hypothetical protein